jgi:hypothetical protein
MPHIELGFTSSPFTIVLLLAVAVVVSYYVYRNTIPPVGTGKRALLTLFRSAALFLLTVLLFEPILRLVFTSQQPPGIAVLIDNSKSMTITDRLGSRKDELTAMFSSSAFRNIANRSGARFFAFGASVKPFQQPALDSISFNQDATDIGSALEHISQERDRQNIRSILLISDGSYNLGQNPIDVAEQTGIPISTIGIGDSSEQKDISVSQLATNDLVYKGTAVPVDVSIKSSGYGNERVEVTLNEGTRELDRRVIVLDRGTREYPVQLSYTPEGEGLRKYSVRVSSLPEELTTKNNQRSFYVKVLKNKLRVVLISGSPSPDVSVIGQTLREDRNIEVSSFSQNINGGFYEGSFSQQQLDSADCLLLIGYPTASTSAKSLGLVTGAIGFHRKPLFFIDGKLLDYDKLKVLSTILPFTTLRIARTEDYAFFHPAESQRSNPILNISPDGSLDAWDKLPPLFRTQSVFRAKPEATVLGFSSIRGVVLHDPMILTRNINRQRSLAVLAYGIWRWRLMAQGSSETVQFLSRFLNNSIKWLTTNDDSRPVKVVTSKEAYTQGEPVEFIGQVYDATAEPVEDAEVTLSVRHGESQVSTSLRPIGNGRYEGSIDGLTQGDYSFNAIAKTEGQQIGDDRGRFSVGELNLEFQDTRMNVQLLRQIAGHSGGRYYSANNLSTLVKDITGRDSFTSREVDRTETIELWNWRYILAVIILLLSIEWFLRKQTGML